jgi:bacillithiol system protein YtxJ
MQSNPTPLRDTAHLDELLELSREHPLLLFKHSHTCGISFEALDELMTHMAERNTGVRYAMVTVQDHREVSNAVAARLGVRHETPQAILIRDGQAVWTASHFRINADSLSKAIQGAIES